MTDAAFAELLATALAAQRTRETAHAQLMSLLALAAARCSAEQKVALAGALDAERVARVVPTHGVVGGGRVTAKRPTRAQFERLLRATLADACAEAPTWDVYEFMDRCLPHLLDVVLELLDNEAREWQPLTHEEAP